MTKAMNSAMEKDFFMEKAIIACDLLRHICLTMHNSMHSYNQCIKTFAEQTCALCLSLKQRMCSSKAMVQRRGANSTCEYCMFSSSNNGTISSSLRSCTKNCSASSNHLNCFGSCFRVFTISAREVDVLVRISLPPLGMYVASSQGSIAMPA